MQAQVQYYLSEIGRKASLLAGGDGKEAQVLICDISTEELADCHVNEKGEISFKLFGYDCSSPTSGMSTKWVYLDAPLTSFAEAVSIVRNSRAAAEAKRAEKRDEHCNELRAQIADKVASTISPVEAWYPDDLKQEIAEHNERVRVENKAREAAKQAAREEADRIDREKQAKRQAEKAAWITENGSEYLKLAVANGYNCERRYVIERAALEFPGFEVLFVADKADYVSRSCPSEAALRESVAINERVGNDVCEVVWVKDIEDEAYFEPREGLVVSGYLGKYELLKY